MKFSTLEFYENWYCLSTIFDYLKQGIFTSLSNAQVSLFYILIREGIRFMQNLTHTHTHTHTHPVLSKSTF